MSEGEGGRGDLRLSLGMSQLRGLRASTNVQVSVHACAVRWTGLRLSCAHSARAEPLRRVILAHKPLARPRRWLVACPISGWLVACVRVQRMQPLAVCQCTSVRARAVC